MRDCIIKLQLLSYGYKGCELKKWMNLCNIFYIMGDRRGVYRVLVAKPEGGRDHLEL